MSLTVAVLIGSLREKSYNRALFNTVRACAPQNVSFREAPIGALPLFNADAEDPLPSAVQEMKEALDRADGILIITPEYNRSVPGVLKNAIDWASRPNGESSWEGKSVATMGATNGSLGTSPAQMHLKGMLVYLNTHPMGQPEFYLGRVKEKLSSDGAEITHEKTRELIASFLTAFQAHIGSHATPSERG